MKKSLKRQKFIDDMLSEGKTLYLKIDGKPEVDWEALLKDENYYKDQYDSVSLLKSIDSYYSNYITNSRNIPNYYKYKKERNQMLFDYSFKDFNFFFSNFAIMRIQSQFNRIIIKDQKQILDNLMNDFLISCNNSYENYLNEGGKNILDTKTLSNLDINFVKWLYEKGWSKKERRLFLLNCDHRFVGLGVFYKNNPNNLCLSCGLIQDSNYDIQGNPWDEITNTSYLIEKIQNYQRYLKKKNFIDALN